MKLAVIGTPAQDAVEISLTIFVAVKSSGGITSKSQNPSTMTEKNQSSAFLSHVS